MSDTTLTGTNFDTSRSDAIEELSGSYAVDPSHNRLGFQARHAMVTNVRGHFSEFTGTVVIDVAEQTLKVHGDLTIRGTAKPVTIELEFTGSAQDPFGNNRAGFEGRAQVNRKDWGLTWNAALETGGVLVSEKIKLDFDVSLVKA